MIVQLNVERKQTGQGFGQEICGHRICSGYLVEPPSHEHRQMTAECSSNEVSGVSYHWWCVCLCKESDHNIGFERTCDLQGYLISLAIVSEHTTVITEQ